MTFDEFICKVDKKARSGFTLEAVICVSVMFGYILVLRLLTRLTRYWPFSNYFTHRSFHYQHRDSRLAIDRVENIIREYGVNFFTDHVYKDSYFIKLTGRFSKLKKRAKNYIPYKRIAERLSKEGMYFRRAPGRRFEVLVNR